MILPVEDLNAGALPLIAAIICSIITMNPRLMRLARR